MRHISTKITAPTVVAFMKDLLGPAQAEPADYVLPQDSGSYRPWVSSPGRGIPLQRFQEFDQFRLLLLGEAQPEVPVVMVHDVRPPAELIRGPPVA
jgi:hypothetical protein